jgi:hypothetical protein
VNSQGRVRPRKPAPEGAVVNVTFPLDIGRRPRLTTIRLGEAVVNSQGLSAPGSGVPG